jgi:hypothetical protein
VIAPKWQRSASWPMAQQLVVPVAQSKSVKRATIQSGATDVIAKIGDASTVQRTASCVTMSCLTSVRSVISAGFESARIAGGTCTGEERNGGSSSGKVLETRLAMASESRMRVSAGLMYYWVFGSVRTVASRG